jgi:hypothetical protein
VKVEVGMLDLNSPMWKNLSHAYGSAANIPTLLEQLKTAGPQKEFDTEPWFSLWSALCHQYDVYSASYAAVPHIIAIASIKPANERLDHLFLAASIEAFRHLEDSPPIPAELQHAYVLAIEQASKLVLECLEQDWQEADYRILLGALAITKGHPQLGNAIFELNEETECPNCQTAFPTRGYDLFTNTGE